jgi:hypothetical protein
LTRLVPGPVPPPGTIASEIPPWLPTRRRGAGRVDPLPPAAPPRRSFRALAGCQHHGDTRPGHQVAHGARDEHLASAGEAANACPDVHGQPGSDLEAVRADLVGDRLRAADRARRSDDHRSHGSGTQPGAEKRETQVGPDAGVGANLGPQLRPVRVASAPTTSFVNCVARTRHGCLEPLANEAEPVRLHYAARVPWICRPRVVIQPREDAD